MVIGFVAAVLGPARSRAYASPAALPRPVARLTTGWGGYPFAGRVSHPLDDIPNFMNSSHDSLPSDQPFLVALFRLCSSEPDHGSTFIVTLKAAVPEKTAQP